MLIKIVAVGRVKEHALAELCEKMLKRIRFDAKIEVLELRDGSRQNECERIIEFLDREQGYVIALSEDGQLVDSVALAARMESIQRRMIFVIGGPAGLDQAVKKRADLVLSLSPMTFTHEMARYILMEQIFRSITITRKRGYHNG